MAGCDLAWAVVLQGPNREFPGRWADGRAHFDGRLGVRKSSVTQQGACEFAKSPPAGGNAQVPYAGAPASAPPRAKSRMGIASACFSWGIGPGIRRAEAAAPCGHVALEWPFN